MAEISEELRRRMIAEAAYFRAEQRGFVDGDPVTDWLEAEHEIDTGLGNGKASTEGHGALAERLATATERLKALRKRLAELSGKARDELEEDIAKLAKRRDRLRKRVNEMREKSGPAAENARHKAEEIWDEISALMERMSRRKAGRS